MWPSFRNLNHQHLGGETSSSYHRDRTLALIRKKQDTKRRFVVICRNLVATCLLLQLGFDLEVVGEQGEFLPGAVGQVVLAGDGVD